MFPCHHGQIAPRVVCADPHVPDLPDTSKCRQAYAVEARQLPRNHVSYSYKFVCISSCKYSSNDICTYLYDQRVDKLIILLHLKSKYVSAYATLPPQHRPKKMLCQVSTHLTQDCERSGRQPTLGQDALHSKKNEAHIPLLPSPRLRGSLPLPRTVPSSGPQAWDWALAGYPRRVMAQKTCSSLGFRVGKTCGGGNLFSGEYFLGATST